jgi:opacity protein-like surface antigen
MLLLMNRPLSIRLLLAAVLFLAAAPGAYGQGIKGREILGFRAGGVLSSGLLNDKFGDGSEIEIHFIEGLNPWFGINIALSSHNLGESKDRDMNIDYTGFDRPVKLQVFSVTAAALAIMHIGDRFSPTLEGGFGLYTINGVIQAGLYEGSITDNQVGFYGGVGLLYRLTRSLFLNANAKYHYIFSGNDWNSTVYFYTGEERITLYQIAVGVAIYTG